MIKILLLIAVIACVSHAEGATWVSWNNFATSNYAYVHGISQPSPPKGFSRYTDSTNSSYAQRPNQYRFTYNTIVSGTTCNIYCGPSSYLTLVNGVYICQRDQDANLWGAFNYDQYCIPDVDLNYACSSAVPLLYSVGYCNMAVYSGISDYQNYSCCYDDHNAGSGLFIDLTKRSVTTSHYSLRNAQ